MLHGCQEYDVSHVQSVHRARAGGYAGEVAKAGIGLKPLSVSVRSDEGPDGESACHHP
jgi:hypothetical protein